MKKVILSVAFVAALMCFGNVAAKPVKKAAKTEQTTAKKAEKATTAKKSTKATAKKCTCKKACCKKASPTKSAKPAKK